MGKTKFDDLAIELSTTLTIAKVFILFFLQSSSAAKVSAVSPDWEINIYKLEHLDRSFINPFYGRGGGLEYAPWLVYKIKYESIRNLIFSKNLD